MPCLGGRAGEEEGSWPARQSYQATGEERTGSLGKKAQFLSLLLSPSVYPFFSACFLAAPSFQHLLFSCLEPQSIRLRSTGEVTTGHRLNQSVRLSVAHSIARFVLFLPWSRFLPTFERTLCYVAAVAVSSSLLYIVRMRAPRFSITRSRY